LWSLKLAYEGVAKKIEEWGKLSDTPLNTNANKSFQGKKVKELKGVLHTLPDAHVKRSSAMTESGLLSLNLQSEKLNTTPKGLLQYKSSHCEGEQRFEACGSHQCV